MTKPTRRPVGRPSKYSEALADRIVEAMIDGADLFAVCQQPGLPDRRTVYRWAAEHPEFASRLEHAREALGDLAAYQIGQIAANCTAETAAADRVKLAALQWRASRLAPRKYSERRVNELVGAGGGPVAVEARPPTINVMALTPEERAILKKGLLRITGQQSGDRE
ncbi:hypothetical protein [Reyranella sp.]|uniref:terminase small subunit-like protein n=1 Tax=Reyranella sp. TaxID=1929291 RepID=UPI00271B6B38|nr:hypothetical protein [Reyranella sp.]MDO8975442.1 hypothetical protein [Reyranella sp.]